MALQFITPIANLAGTWLKGRQKKAEEKQKLEVAKIQAQVKRVQSDANWEEKAMDASASSWKDELWTLLFCGLIFAGSIPAGQPYLSDGFRFLREDCPDWLSWGILASIGASFGLKSIGQFKK